MVKIGRTNDSNGRRKKEIQNMSPVLLYSIGKIKSPNAARTEKELHNLFDPYRQWGEWFEFPDDDLRTLKRCVKSIRQKRKHKEDKLTFDMKSFVAYWERRLYSV